MVMKFHELVKAHFAWRNNLLNEIKNGVTEQMILDTHKDDLCAIGHWFHGEGQNLFAGVAEFEAAKKAHAQFHQSVSLSLSKDAALAGDEQFDVMLKAFRSLNDKIGHMD